MNNDELVHLIEEILEVEPGTLNLDDRLSDIDWDSLANISFIAEVDQKLGLSLDADRLSKAESVSDLVQLVTDAGAQQ